MERAEFEAKVEQIGAILGYQVEHSKDRPSFGSKLSTWVANDQRFREDITINNGGWSKAGRITVSGWYPHAKDGSRCDYGIDNVEITVAETKTAAQIVKDMERRFFPAYRHNLNKVIASVKEHEEQAAIQAATIKALAKQIGITDIRDDQAGHPYRFYWYLNDCYIEVTANYSGSVKIEARGISYAQAKAALLAMKGAENEPVPGSDD